jgi:hypothetical protein
MFSFLASGARKVTRRGGDYFFSIVSARSDQDFAGKGMVGIGDSERGLCRDFGHKSECAEGVVA